MTDISSDPTLIDSIVRGVLERLSQGNGRPSATPTAPARPAVENRVLVLMEPVVTAETLKSRVNGHSQIAFGPKTVLTPSAREFLKSHQLPWDRHQNQGKLTAATLAWQAVVLSDAERLLPMFSQLGDWKVRLAGSLAEAVEWSTSALSRGETGGIVLGADAAYRAACRANRIRGVRAVAVADTASIENASRQLGANLYCVAPSNQPYYALRNLIKACQQTTPRPPDDWQE